MFDVPKSAKAHLEHSDPVEEQGQRKDKYLGATQRNSTSILGIQLEATMEAIAAVGWRPPKKRTEPASQRTSRSKLRVSPVDPTPKGAGEEPAGAPAKGGASASGLAG